MNRIMCIDYGDSRIGVALTDPLRIIVSAHSTIQNNEKSLDAIKDIFISKNVLDVVIGLPYGKDGEIGPAALKIIDFAKKLKQNFDDSSLEALFYYQDERYTTREANETMKNIGVRKKRRQSVVDQIAACNILTAFLESKYKEKIIF